jgi:hypothetical protein
MLEVLYPAEAAPEPDAGECVTFLPTDPHFRYWPNHPFLEPGASTGWPSGFLSVSWDSLDGWLDNLLGPLVGMQATDAITFWAVSLPGAEDEPYSGDVWPGFAFPFYIGAGGGHLELELLDIPYGGLATIVMDGNLWGANFVNLGTDPLELADPEAGWSDTVAPEIIRLEVEEGHHVLEVRYVFWAQLEPPYLLYGGGFRSLKVCGLDIMAEDTDVLYIGEEDGHLYWSAAGVYPDVDLGLVRGADGEDGADGATGATGPAGADGADGVCNPDDCSGADASGGIPDPVPGPAVSQADVSCGVARALTDHIIQVVEDGYDAVIAGGTVAEILAATAGALFFGVGAIIASGIVAIFGGMAIATATSRKATLTAAHDDIMCSLECSLDTTGSIDRTVLDTWSLEVSALAYDCSGDVSAAIDALYVNEARQVAVIGVLDPVTACGCSCSGAYDVTVDFKTGLHGWLFDTTGGSKGEQNATRGIQSVWHSGAPYPAQRLWSYSPTLNCTGCTLIEIHGHVDVAFSNNVSVILNGTAHNYTKPVGDFTITLAPTVEVDDVTFSWFPSTGDAGSSDFCSFETIRFVGDGNPPNVS